MKKIISIVLGVFVMVSTLTSTFTATANADEVNSDVVATTSNTGWEKNGGKYSYKNVRGDKIVGWNRLNGLWYYFNSKGEMVTGTQSIGSKTYLFSDKGILQQEVVVQNKKSANTTEVKKDPNQFYTRNGQPLGTGKKYISNASAYTGDTTTASGQRPRWGTIAVDPKVIPLGSKVYVPYFDKVFIANDTGGIIRGTMIDVFMNNASSMYKFGRRNLEIVVLDK